MTVNHEPNATQEKSAVQTYAAEREIGYQHPVYDADTLALAQSGMKQVLERRFGLISMTGFACGLMCTWESVLVVFLLGLQNGGPGGLIYSFLVVWLGTSCVFASIGELASMQPTAAGQYHWVNTLAGQAWKRFWSYTIGWITVVSWIAGIAASAFFTGSLVLALAVLNNPDYEPTGWHGTLVFWAVLLGAALLNTFGGKLLPALEIAILILHIIGFFAIIIPLLVLSDKVSTSEVFTGVSSNSGWAPGLAFFIGANGNATAFLGTDGPVHMAEEVKNAQRNVPRSMLLSSAINGLLSFGMLVAVLYCLTDLDDAIANAPNGYAFMVIFASGVRSIPGASAMTAVILVLEFCSCVGSMAGGSRITWSFARDNGLPGSQSLSEIDSRTTVPVRAVLLVTICAALIGLINIGSATAFNDVVSLVFEAYYASYLITCGLLLYRRVKGQIGEADLDGTGSIHSATKFTWGPWHLPGWLGTLNNVVAIVYLVVLMVFGFFPPVLPVTADNMNYSCLMLGAVAIFSCVYYYASAKRVYNGPAVEAKLQKI